MPKVEQERAVPLAASVLEDALEGILHGIATQGKPWTGFSLHLSIRDIGLPDVGYISVPIRLRSARETNASGQFQMTLHIEAAKNPRSFPVFEGHCGVSVLGASRSNFWLGGTYTVPLKSFGIFFDATLLHGAAERCLRNFIDDIIAACVARVEQSEQQYLASTLARKAL